MQADPLRLELEVDHDHVGDSKPALGDEAHSLPAAKERRRKTLTPELRWRLGDEARAPSRRGRASTASSMTTAVWPASTRNVWQADDTSAAQPTIRICTSPCVSCGSDNERSVGVFGGLALARPCLLAPSDGRLSSAASGIRLLRTQAFNAHDALTLCDGRSESRNGARMLGTVLERDRSVNRLAGSSGRSQRSFDIDTSSVRGRSMRTLGCALLFEKSTCSTSSMRRAY